MLRRVPIPSPNYSGRAGTPVRLIVLHTAQGATSYADLGAFFANPASGVSSHVGIDDTPGTVGEYVPRAGKAWTQGNANPYSVAAELCAWAEWSPGAWSAHPNMIANTAAWVAEEAAHFGLPIVALTAAQAQDGRSRGVCQHADLGASGGGHWDCGPGFPMAQVIALAGGSGAPTTEDDDMPYTQAQLEQFAQTGAQRFFATPEGHDRIMAACMDAIEDPRMQDPLYLAAQKGAQHFAATREGHDRTQVACQDALKASGVT